MPTIAAKPVRLGLFNHLSAGGALAAPVLATCLLTSLAALPQAGTSLPPQTLQETGLYADFANLRVDPNHVDFVPQYPLWSDGAAKRRWMSLPPGTAIDAADPDAWVFPIGTRFWKEFSFAGHRVETRYLERTASGQWLYAAYAWSPDGREAQLVPARGKRGAFPLTGGRSHTIPGANDCRACHQGGRSEVLGFSLLQLSPDRDPNAVHDEPASSPRVDLRHLVDRGLIKGLPKAVLETPPRIQAASPIERTALGYMHGNCGHCHNWQGPLQNIGLFLRHEPDTKPHPAVTSTVGQSIRKPAPGQSPDAAVRIKPAHPDQSGVMQRVSSRYPALQMPPLGTELVDDEAVSLLYRWISEMQETRQQAHLEEEEK